MKNFQIWKSKIYEVFQDLGYMRFEHTSRVYEIYRGVYLNYKEDKGYVVKSLNSLYLKDYRYYCFDNADSSIARRTLGVLSLNDSTENVYKRYLIGNELHSKIDEIAELAIENEKILKTKTTMRNRIRNGCKNILKQGFPEAVYSAFMATLIFNDENFKTCMEILKRQDIWDDELEESFQKMNNNVFKIRRE